MTTTTAHDDAGADLSRALAAMLHRDARPPCCDGTGRWLSEVADVRARAAEECAGCELLAPCAEAGLVESWGVWGGEDVSTRPIRRRARRPTQSSNQQRRGTRDEHHTRNTGRRPVWSGPSPVWPP